MNTATALARPASHPRTLLAAVLLTLVCPLALATAAHAGASAAPPAADRNLGFLTPIDFLPHKELQVLTVDGRVLRGIARTSSNGPRGISRFTLVDADGTRHPFRAADLVRVSAPVGPGVRAAMIDSATTTIEKASNTDWSQIENVNELIFDSVAWPKPDDRVLLMRLNPGFDQNFRVYALNTSREGITSFGKVAAFGDEIKAHIVIKGDQPPIKVKKDDYTDLFPTLFGDCPQMLTAYTKKQREFSDFANHLAHYDRECTPAPTPQQASR